MAYLYIHEPGFSDPVLQEQAWPRFEAGFLKTTHDEREILLKRGAFMCSVVRLEG